MFLCSIQANTLVCMFHRVITVHISLAQKQSAAAAQSPNSPGPFKDSLQTPSRRQSAVESMQRKVLNFTETLEASSPQLPKVFSSPELCRPSSDSEVSSADTLTAGMQEQNGSATDSELMSSETELQSTRQHQHKGKASKRSMVDIHPEMSFQWSQYGQHAELLEFLSQKSTLVLSSKGVIKQNQLPVEKPLTLVKDEGKNTKDEKKAKSSANGKVKKVASQEKKMNLYFSPCKESEESEVEQYHIIHLNNNEEIRDQNENVPSSKSKQQRSSTNLTVRANGSISQGIGIPWLIVERKKVFYSTLLGKK